MLASGFEQRLVDKIEFPALVQLKLDGMRFNAIVSLEEEKVELRSRNGKELVIPNEEFSQQFFKMAEMMGLGDIVFDGELLVLDQDNNPIDRQTGNGILSKSIKGTMSQVEAQSVHATLWDAIPLVPFKQGKFDTPYSIRFSDLKNFIEIMRREETFSDYVSVVESQLAVDYDSAQKIFQEYLENGEEGIILKSRDNVWEDKRAKDQIKFKGELECDLKIVGVEAGTGKYEGMLGAILCETSDGVIKVSVGSGFNDEQRKTLNEEDLLGKVVAVKYNARIQNKSGDESLFLPIFVEVREDKSNADSSKDVK
jgi:ATP-dependent DNA ligase